MKRYRVLFLGLLDDAERFKKNMMGMGVRPDLSEKILQRAPVFLKAGMVLGDALKYAEAVQKAGGKVKLLADDASAESQHVSRPNAIKPFDFFTMCSQCGHKQPRAERCVRCGCSFPGSAEGDDRSR